MKKRGWGLIILVFGVFLAVRVGLNLVSLQRAGGRLQEEETRLAQVRKENLELKEGLAEVKTPEYMEREVREKLGMGKEGEVVIIIPPEDLQIADSQIANAEPEEPNWMKWRKLYLGW